MFLAWKQFDNSNVLFQNGFKWHLIEQFLREEFASMVIHEFTSRVKRHRYIVCSFGSIKSECDKCRNLLAFSVVQEVTLKCKCT